MSKWHVTELAIELTEACNFKCSMCDYWKIRQPKHISLVDAKKFIDMVPSQQLHSVLLTGGEPLLHKGWRDIVSMIPDSARKYLCTNGSVFQKKNLRDVANKFDRVTISVDGATNRTFKEIRGRDSLSEIVAATRKLREEKSELEIFYKFTIQKDNIDEVYDFFEFSAKARCISGIRFGLPDMSFNAFALEKTARDMNDYTSQVMPTELQVENFRAQVKSINQDFGKEIAQGFLVEGNLVEYADRLHQMAKVGDNITERNCEIPNRTLFIKASGQVGSCYFLGPEVTIDEITRPNIVDAYRKKIEQFSSKTNPICQRCGQCSILSTAPPLAQ